MAVSYLRLFDPTQQFQLKNGAINTSGRLFVYLESTDDLADLYDENGTQLQQPVVLDNNGRARGLFVDAAKVYWLDVQDQYGESLFTVRKMSPCGGGSGSVLGGKYDVICSDGSIFVDKYDNAGITTFDLSTSNEDSVESLDWFSSVGSYHIPETDMYKPSCVEGTMELGDLGVLVGADKYYHVTAHLVATKNETRQPYYEDISVKLKLRDVEDNTWTTVADIGEIVDYSMTDEQEYEISTDIMVGKDSELVFFVEGQGVPGGQFEFKDVKIHRVYSGAPKLPDTCASKNWVSAHFEEKLTWNYNSADKITGVNGSAFAGGSGGGGSGVDPEQVSAIASAYADSAASGKLDKSASAMFQPSGDYQTAGDYAYNSSLSSKLDSSAFNSSDFYPTSNPSGFVTGVDLDGYATTAYVDSAVSGKLDSTAAYTPEYGFSGDRISSIDGSALVGGGDYSGVAPVNVDNVNHQISVDHRTLCVDETMAAYLSGDSAVLGVAVDSLGLSAKLDASASSDFYSTSNPSGFVTGVDLSDYATTAYVDSSVSSKLDSTAFSTVSGTFLTSVDLSDYATTAYVDSSVSGKLDSTAFDPNAFYPSGNPSGFITGVDLSDYATKEYVDSSVSSKLDTTAFNSGDFYPADNPSGFITGVDLTPYQTTADMSGYLQTAESANYYPTSNPSGFITGMDLTDYATTDYVDSSVSGKLDSSAFNSGDFYPAGNPSGFITGVDLSDYASTAYVDSSLSSKLDSTASSDFYSTSNPSGFLTAAYTPTFGYDGSNISSIDGSALAGGGGVDESTVSAIASAYAESAASSKLDSTATGDFYSTSNPSGFLTAAYSPTFAYSGTAISSIDGSAVYDVSAQDGITALSAEIGDINTILQSI